MKKRIVMTFVVPALIVAVAGLLVGAERRGSGGKSPVGINKTAGIPVSTMSNVNRVAAWYSANGEQERIPGSGNSGLYFPRGTTTAIYSAGIMWSGIFNDGRSPAIRSNGQSYQNGTRPGAILGIRTGVAEDPNADDVRIWRIRKDYATADLTRDAAEINSKTIFTVTAGEIQATRDQYAKDWKEWPSQKGAPFYDVGYLNSTLVLTGANNGVFDRGEDLDQDGILDAGEDANLNGELDGETPGVGGADQVIWYVCNDIGVAQPWTCPETGMEEQATIWAYDRGDALGNVIFKRFRLIYKGTGSTPANATIDSMYMCQWSDPDLGNSADDYAGCDTTRSLGYVYNAIPVDALYSGFGLAPPASGYDFLQGPFVPGVAGQDLNKNGVDDASDFAIYDLKRVGPGYINLPMTSFIYFAAGGLYGDPLFNYGGALEWNNMLRGFPPRPPGAPLFINPVTGLPTQYWLSGDPVAGTGWIDGTLDAQGDRRILLNSGPFTMAVDDTQELVSAWVGGLGSDYLSSITVMKFNDGFVQTAYDSLFSLPGPPPRPKVRAIGFDRKVLIDWEFDSAAVAKTENTTVIGNYRFQGYKIYQFSDASANPATAKLLAHYDSTNGITIVEMEVIDPLTGRRYLVGVELGTDNGVKRTLSISEDKFRSRELANGQAYYFGVTAYNYSYDSLTALGVPSYESAPTVVVAVAEKPKPGTQYTYTIGDTVSVRDSTGQANNAIIFPVIYNPNAAAGVTYRLRFDTTATGAFRWTLTNPASGKLFYSNITDLTGTKPFRVSESGFDLFVASPLVGTKTVLDGAGKNVFGPGSADPTYAALGSLGTLASITGTGRAGRNFEIRFDTGSFAVRNGGTGVTNPLGVLRVPFSVWDLGRVPSDTARKMIAYANWDLFATTRGVWGIDTSRLVLSGVSYSVFEEISITTFPYPTTNDSASVFAQRFAVLGAGQNQSNVSCAVYKVSIWDRDGDGIPPDTGTTIRFEKYLEIHTGDVKTITPTAVVTGNLALAREAVSQIKAFPNPYYGANRAETDKVSRFITFSHLPTRATIRIFNLAGALVRTIEKNDVTTQFQRWDLQNQNGLPVASGLYIVFIDMPDLGSTKTLKVAIIQEQQFLKFF